VARRRGAGEGSVWQRSDGRWEARLDLGLDDGRRRYKAIYGKTQRAAIDRLREEQAKVRAGLPPTVGRAATVERFLRSWVESQRSRVRANTWRR
jgi:hypothetical protein